MKCDKCGNEDLHVVSEYVELSEKKNYGIITFLISISIICFAIGIVCLFPTLSDSDRFNTPFMQAGGGIATIIFLGFGIYLGLTLSLIRVFSAL